MTYSEWLLVYKKAMPTCAIIGLLDFSDYVCIENFRFVTCRKLSHDKTIRLTSLLGTRAREKNCHPVESYVRNFCRPLGKVVV